MLMCLFGSLIIFQRNTTKVRVSKACGFPESYILGVDINSPKSFVIRDPILNNKGKFTKLDSKLIHTAPKPLNRLV